MIDWTKPVRTRDGREARVLCTDRVCVQGSHYPVLALVKNGQGDEVVQSYTIEGSYYHTGTTDPNDLENVPEVTRLWVNVYPDDVTGYADREWDDEFAQDDRAALLRLDFEGDKLIKVETVGDNTVDTHG